MPKIEIWKNRNHKYTVRTKLGIIELTKKEVEELKEILGEVGNLH